MKPAAPVISLAAFGEGEARPKTADDAQKNLAPLVPVDRATNHQNQGRQSAVDKKRGQNPVKETAAMLAKPAGVGEGRIFRPAAGLPCPQIKNPNSLKAGN